MNFLDFSKKFKAIIQEEVPENKSKIYMVQLNYFLNRNDFAFDKNYIVAAIYELLNLTYNKTKDNLKKHIDSKINNIETMVKKHVNVFDEDIVAKTILEELEKLNSESTTKEVQKICYNILNKFSTDIDLFDIIYSFLPESYNEKFIENLSQRDNRTDAEGNFLVENYSMYGTFVSQKIHPVTDKPQLKRIESVFSDASGLVHKFCNFTTTFGTAAFRFTEGKKYLLLFNNKSNIKDFIIANSNEVFLFNNYGSRFSKDDYKIIIKLLLKHFFNDDARLLNILEEMLGFKAVNIANINNKEARVSLFKEMEKEKLRLILKSYAESEKFWYEDKPTYVLNKLKIEEDSEKILSIFPVKMTKEQTSSINRIKDKLINEDRIEIILQGDTGTGKTYVFTWLTFILALNKRKSFIILPTKILAKQVYDKTIVLAEKLGIKVSRTIEKKSKIVLEDDTADIFIGSVGLDNFTDNIKPMAIIYDESQRYGMDIKQKNIYTDIYLYSSATIEPALEIQKLIKHSNGFLYIEMFDRFILIEPKTYIIYEAKKVVDTIMDVLNKKEKTIFIINDKNKLEQTKEYFANKFKKEGKNYIVETLYSGKKGSDDIVDKFHKKEIQLLLSSTIIECGFDTPGLQNIFMDGDNLSFSSIWQIKGRNARDSSCTYNNVYIFTQKQEDNKFEDFIKCTNCIEVSELDAKIRGFGNIVTEGGIEQKGKNLIGYFYDSLGKDIIKQIALEV